MIAIIIVAFLELVLIVSLAFRVKRNEELMYKIADVVIKEKLKESMDNLHKGLENLFNPKDTKNENKRKTNDKVKHKN